MTATLDGISGAEQVTGRYVAGRDHSHIDLTLVIPFYLSQETGPASLIGLLRRYAAYPAALMDRIQFVLVDDASPVRVELPADINLNLLRLRILVDIPWNQGGARNLGMVYARSDKVLATDLDHEFDEETLRTIVQMRNPGKTVYKMGRVNPDGSPRRAHPNTFVLSRARFLKFHGCDEEFSGHYGYEDAMFWRWQRNQGTRFLYLPKRCVARCRTLNLTECHSLVRDLQHNSAIADRKKREMKQFGSQAGHSRRFLCFPWSLEEDRERAMSAPPVRSPRRLWASTWWWRWLVGPG